MEKMSFIMIMLFLFVGIAHFVSLKVIDFSVEKKNRLRRIFFYFYGMIYVVIGVIQLVYTENQVNSSSLQIIIGVIFIVLNYLKKLDPKE
ncbi:MAG: quinol-cytochrome oxidoreductase complex cytochrome b subunit [Candidatus Arcticimaribacter sp.]|jgi:quinol-cytochrome oxidoreductase complex cytochrome b subunit|tara:strand:+ start:70 stop:339 length:270 start_codon:yes stop_codon:yes gene_type:complete